MQQFPAGPAETVAGSIRRAATVERSLRRTSSCALALAKAASLVRTSNTAFSTVRSRNRVRAGQCFRPSQIAAGEAQRCFDTANLRFCQCDCRFCRSQHGLQFFAGARVKKTWHRWLHDCDDRFTRLDAIADVQRNPLLAVWMGNPQHLSGGWRRHRVDVAHTRLAFVVDRDLHRTLGNDVQDPPGSAAARRTRSAPATTSAANRPHAARFFPVCRHGSVSGFEDRIRGRAD